MIIISFFYDNVNRFCKIFAFYLLFLKYIDKTPSKVNAYPCEKVCVNVTIMLFYKSDIINLAETGSVEDIIS